jgi:hypothetical protein
MTDDQRHHLNALSCLGCSQDKTSVDADQIIASCFAQSTNGYRFWPSYTAPGPWGRFLQGLTRPYVHYWKAHFASRNPVTIWACGILDNGGLLHMAVGLAAMDVLGD